MVQILLVLLPIIFSVEVSGFLIAKSHFKTTTATTTESPANSIRQFCTKMEASSSPSHLTSSITTNSNNSLGAQTLKELVLQAAEEDVAQTMDLNGIMWLEHINLVVGSRPMAERFYLDLIGFTKDKSTSFHVNMGQQQFHLAAVDGETAQRITGSIGLAVPNLATVRQRLKDALDQEDDWKDTKFAILEDDTSNYCMTIQCPWGNRFHLYDIQAENDSLEPPSDSPHKMVRLHTEGGSYAARRMAVRGNPGIRYIEIACPVGTTSALAQFYQDMVGCTITRPTIGGTKSQSPLSCCVNVGPGVHLVFVENENLSDNDLEAMKGVHICIYANDFKGFYDRLKARDLIWTNPRFLHLDSCDTWEEATASRTLRFKDLIDLNEGKGEKVLELEHETRPLRHGQYLKVPFYEPK